MNHALLSVRGLALSACLAVPCFGSALAAEPAGVLKKIRDSGQITLGYRESSIPFSYLDDKAQPVGYSMELCGRVVDAVKKELKGMAAASATPNDYALSTEGYSVDPYALMFAKGDADFKRLVDGAITAAYRSGEINPIYERWYLKPIPPKGINLNFAMGPVLKSAIATPTDSPDPSAYH